MPYCRSSFGQLLQACHLSYLSPSQSLLSIVLTECFEAAADRGLRLTYCTVNGHQVGAPAGGSMGSGVVIRCNSSHEIEKNVVTVTVGKDGLRFGGSERFSSLHSQSSISSRT